MGDLAHSSPPYPRKRVSRWGGGRPAPWISAFAGMTSGSSLDFLSKARRPVTGGGWHLGSLSHPSLSISSETRLRQAQPERLGGWFQRTLSAHPELVEGCPRIYRQSHPGKGADAPQVAPVPPPCRRTRVTGARTKDSRTPRPVVTPMARSAGLSEIASVPKTKTVVRQATSMLSIVAAREPR